MGAWELPTGKHGLLTHWLLQSLDQGADADEDRLLTTTELEAFLKARVPPQARQELRFGQTPILLGAPGPRPFLRRLPTAEVSKAPEIADVPEDEEDPPGER